MPEALIFIPDDNLKRHWLNYRLRGGIRPNYTSAEIDYIEACWTPHIKKLVREAIPKIQKSIAIAHKHKKKKLKLSFIRKLQLKKKRFEFITRVKYTQIEYVGPWINYEDYCKSKCFKKWKREVLRRYGYICQKCGKLASIAHHICYRKWGTEIVTDGIAVCFNCHNIIHASKKS